VSTVKVMAHFAFYSDMCSLSVGSWAVWSHWALHLMGQSDSYLGY